MANIADNKFFLSFGEDCTKEDIELVRKQIDHLFEEHLEGELYYDEEDSMEGWFTSRWSFPHEYWEEILGEKPIYFRCLTEEYGCGLVSMNIHDEDGEWRESQYFDL